MFHRIGLAIDDEEWGRIRSLQRRLRIKSRSRFFREIIRRYEKLEGEYRALAECRLGYFRKPEKPQDQKILRSSLKKHKNEAW